MEIVRGISQVMANSHDGALDDKGEPIKVGLKREDGDPIIDSRVMDGFKVSYHGPQLCIHYHSEMKLKDVYANGFESDLEQMIADIAKFIKKEYKIITGSALSLKAVGDVDAIVQQTSRVRTWVQAKQYFDIGGIDAEEINSSSEDNIEEKFKSFLDQGGWKKADPKGQPVRKDGKVKARKDIHSPFKAE
jgi:reverse gyrase